MTRHGMFGVRQLAVLAFGLSLTLANLQASFVYKPRDLMLSFRQQGASSELEVNIGSITNYLGLAPGATVQISQYDTNQLATAFFAFDNLSWSVSSCVYQDSSDTNYPNSTLWVTRPRVDPAVQASPWLRKSSFSQVTTAARVFSIGQGAAGYSSSQPPDPTSNTDTAVILPAGNPQAASIYVGALGNFQNTFQGDVENTTPQDFSTAGQPVRSDLYQLIPGSGATLNTAGLYLGYFEFRPDGTASFTAAGGSSVPLSNIKSIARAGNVTTVSFTTVAGATYGLRFTDSAGLATPLSAWSASGVTVTGSGSVLTLQDTTNDPNRFYVVTAVPASGTALANPALQVVSADDVGPSVTSWQRQVSVMYRSGFEPLNRLETGSPASVARGSEL